MSSEAINIDFAPTGQYPPYKFGTTVEDVGYDVGDKLYCVEFLDATAVGKLDGPGAWMGQQLFANESEAREAFSLLPEFKPESQSLVIREYIVKQPIKARVGVAGPLTSPSNGHAYSGGEIQIQLLDKVNYSPTWKGYFVEQPVLNGIRAYVKKL
ncbi:hypothetical protein GCM10028808_26040 [Spirosoma migulaei]